MSRQRTAQEFEQTARKGGIAPGLYADWRISNCSICGVPIGYWVDHNFNVFWDGSCDCSSAYGMQPRTWQEIADHYNLQTNDEVIAKYDQFWGFDEVSK